ncbi:MAG: adaptor protein MecA [Clostridia bacterium]|nr:adaptor protein MecA [Clostridia bacterium]
MRFEKINENKIRITLNLEDLEKRHIDFHSFMTDSIESQDLFFYCLNKAEKEIGFITKDYRLRIEAISIPSSGDFILIVTRTLPEKKKNYKKNLHMKKKTINTSQTQAVYCFSSFDNYLAFIYFLKNNNFKFSNLADYVLLYEYKKQYFLVLNNINLLYPNLKKLLYCITEFSSFINNSSIYMSKLAENGNLIMKHNALKSSIKQL